MQLSVSMLETMSTKALRFKFCFASVKLFFVVCCEHMHAWHFSKATCIVHKIMLYNNIVLHKSTNKILLT